MDYPWSHHPPPPPPPAHQGNPHFCPTCSFSHFPFCPSPPIPYNNQNPKFHSPIRPRFDSPFVESRPWHANLSLDNHRNYNESTAYSPFDHGIGSGYKRVREDEAGAGSGFYDNDRRLRLIRDHGGPVDSNGYFSDSSNFDHGYSSIDPVKRQRFDEFKGGKSYTTLNSSANYNTSDFRDPRFSDFDRKVGSFCDETTHNFGNNELGMTRYSLDKGPLDRSLQTNLRDNYEWRSRFMMENRGANHFSPQSYSLRSDIPPNHELHSRGHVNESSFWHHISPQDKQGNNIISESAQPIGVTRAFSVQPPLPVSPPPPLPMDPQRLFLADPQGSVSQANASSLFPISGTSSAPMMAQCDPTLAQPYVQDKSHFCASAGMSAEEFQPASQRLSMNYPREGQSFPLVSSNKPKAIDASQIFKQPHRATRPDHIVVILRGLPGSGKSYLAKMMRDLEVENGGKIPRIYSMDDYFMTEVEKIEESDSIKSSGSGRGKKPLVKKVMEYCYEAEMEEAYRSSMLKTFKKTLDEGAFSFVIVDDRNLRVADFAQFWAIAKRSGYEVYLLEATYKDPAGCAARNVHNFTLDDIQKMAGQWEEAPSMYLKLDTKSLLQGDDLKENGIQEVDMDMDNGDSEDALHGSAERDSHIFVPTSHNYSSPGPSKADDSWKAESDHTREEVKELGRSKWSNDLEDEDADHKEASKGNPNALSGLFKSYAKDGKFVHWGDQAANMGFSIGAVKKVNKSLVIGPGAGYNLNSNPLPEELVSPGNTSGSKRQNVFQERIRAERESFRAVFDKRRHRIGGLDLDEE